MAGVVLVPGVVAAVPGGEASCTVRVRNTGSVVDSYTITVLGEPAAWATPMPAVLSLFPGAEGEATISFRPPRSPELAAGPVDFAVRVVATEDADGSVVEEGVVTVDAYQEVVARITPRTSETKRVARHTISVENRGNAPLTLDLAATDPDEVLAFDLRPATLTVGPGETGNATVKAMARRGFARGTDRHRPFQATVMPQPAGMHPPTLLDATLVQRAGLPRFVPALVAAVVVIALAAVLIPSFTKKDDGGRIELTGSEPTTTITVPGAGDEEGGAEAEAATDEAGAPATTNPPNRQGTSSGAAAGGATAAAGSGGATATTAAPAATSDSPGPTTPDAKPITSTTTPPSTTPTAPPTVFSQGTKLIHGTYLFDFDSGNEQSAGADTFWRQSTSTARQLEPYGGALFHNFGVTNYDALTYDQLKSASYSANAIDGSDGSSSLAVGTVIGVKTNSGKWSKVRIEARNVYDPGFSPQYNNHLRVRWITYN